MPKQWSTKTLTVLEPTSASKMGVGLFEFTDDYSVFHYSKMQDTIPYKGEALCRMAVFSLKLLEAQGIKTHLREFHAPKTIALNLVRLLYPQDNEIKQGDKNYLIPLQVICRNQLPKNASVFRRLANGHLTLSDLGLKELPRVGESLQSPIIEFTTKLEEIDRFVSYSEAQQLAGLTDAQFKEVQEVALAVNQIITAHADKKGLVHADSKIELAIDDEGNIIVVDTIGTPDENRLLYKSCHLTKQLMRDYYLLQGLEKDVQEWSKAGIPRSEWPKPAKLPEEFLDTVSLMYRSLTDHWCGDDFFNTCTLDEMIIKINKLNLTYLSQAKSATV